MDIFFSEEGMVTKGENVVMDSMYHFCNVIDYNTYTPSTNTSCLQHRHAADIQFDNHNPYLYHHANLYNIFQPFFQF